MELAKHWAARLEDYAMDLAWSPDGSLLAAASASGPIAIFPAADGARLHDLPGHDQGTNVLAWQACLASAGQDGSVKLWDAGAGQHTATASLGAAWVEQLAWDGPLLAASCGRALTLINPDGTVRNSLDDAPKTISAIAWKPHPAGGPPETLAFAYFGGVRLLNPGDMSVSTEYAYPNGIHALAWSPEGRWLVSGNQDPSVHLWLPDRGEELHMSGFEGKVRYLSFDPTGRWLATGGGRDASVWDCSGSGPEGREPAMLPHEAPVCALAFQRAHGLLASASKDGVVNLWSPERPQPMRATIRLPSPASKLAWSCDDRLLAIGTEQGAVYVLRTQ
jgi:WD40 repeat protein